jgi:hypothetical protein
LVANEGKNKQKLNYVDSVSSVLFSLGCVRVIKANDTAAGGGGGVVDRSKDVDRRSSPDCFTMLTGQ